MAAHPGRRRRHGVRRQPARVPDGPDAQVGRAVGLRARRRRDGGAPARGRRRARPARRDARAPRVRRAHLQPGRPPGRARRARRRCSRPRSPRSTPTLVLAPFGLANPDHDVTHRACMLARERLGDDVSWWCYEDNGYKHIPGMLAWRVSSLFRRRHLADAGVPDDRRRPRRASRRRSRATRRSCSPSRTTGRSAPSSPRPRPSSSGASPRRPPAGNASPRADPCGGPRPGPLRRTLVDVERLWVCRRLVGLVSALPRWAEIGDGSRRPRLGLG